MCYVWRNSNKSYTMCYSLCCVKFKQLDGMVNMKNMLRVLLHMLYTLYVKRSMLTRLPHLLLLLLLLYLSSTYLSLALDGISIY